MIYDVLYSDPPWNYDNKRTGGSLKSGAASKYSTMTVDEICTINIPSAKNSVLFLWVTVPMLQEGLQVMNAWGYKYKTTITWMKTGRLGLGFWFRGNTEFLLFGVKGKVKAFRTNIPNVIQHPVLNHSEKPEVFRELIEKTTPHMPRKLEMFARKKSENWHVWGDEVESNIKL